MEVKILKNRLEEIRNERGINQEVLAKDLSVSRQTISSLENGRYNPSIILAFKIACHDVYEDSKTLKALKHDVIELKENVNKYHKNSRCFEEK